MTQQPRQTTLSKWPQQKLQFPQHARKWRLLIKMTHFRVGISDHCIQPPHAPATHDMVLTEQKIVLNGHVRLLWPLAIMFQLTTQMTLNTQWITLNNAFSVFGPSTWGAGIAQWLALQTHVQKGHGFESLQKQWIIFFSRVNFLCWLLFWYLFRYGSSM